MREGFDKEIDSLLRRRAGAGVRSFDGDATRDDAHLDADELSAFAEGALPAAARGAVVSHLADCGECRGMAVALTRASGAEAELERRAVAASVPASGSKTASRRGWLSALFAPRVLRYVAPALVVCLVAAVSFVALRSRRDSGQLAQRTESGAPAPVAITQAPSGAESNASSNANAEGLTATTTGESRNASAPAVAGKGGGAAAESEVAAGPADAKKDAPAAAPASPPPASKAGEAPAETAAVLDKPAPEEAKEAPKTENKEKAAPRPVVSEDETVAAEQPSQQQKRGNTRSVEVQSPDGSRAQKRGVVDNVSNNASGGSLASNAPRSSDRDGNTGAAASRRGRSSGDARQKAEDDAAARNETTRAESTRAAAGHRFRLDGGVWTDVNYRSSMPSTGVRRGTEAFRALVADIPELGRVAEQISGEVVVVVRGRAYRIR